MAERDPRRTTQLLNLYGGGDRSVEDELLAGVYGELRALAAAHMRQAAPDHTLQPTALLHEAWMRIAKQDGLAFDARAQFYRLASRVMRSVLVDHQRGKLREKRGGGRLALSLEGAAEPSVESDVDLITLEDSLKRLEQMEPELCRIVELRFFGGLTHPEIAETLGTSLRTVERNWRLARAWLQAELGA